MFDNTITIARDGTNVVFTKLRDDKGVSTYINRSATEQTTLSIRHATEGQKADGREFERHNFAYERRIFATPATKEVLESTNITVRFQVGTDPVSAQKTASAAVAFATVANLVRLINGEN